MGQSDQYIIGMMEPDTNFTGAALVKRPERLELLKADVATGHCDLYRRKPDNYTGFILIMYLLLKEAALFVDKEKTGICICMRSAVILLLFL